MRKPNDVLETDVAFAPFDARHVGEVHSTGGRELLLGSPLCEAKLADAPAKLGSDR